MPDGDRRRRRWLRRLTLIGAVGGIATLRKRKLDAADRAFPEATTGANASVAATAKSS